MLNGLFKGVIEDVFLFGLFLLFNGARIMKFPGIYGLDLMSWLRLNATSNQLVVSNQSYSMSFVRQ